MAVGGCAAATGRHHSEPFGQCGNARHQMGAEYVQAGRPIRRQIRHPDLLFGHTVAFGRKGPVVAQMDGSSSAMLVHPGSQLFQPWPQSTLLSSSHKGPQRLPPSSPIL